MRIRGTVRLSALLLAVILTGSCGSCGDAGRTTSNNHSSIADAGPDVSLTCRDEDGDGAFAGECPEADDCNDGDAQVHPGADEICGNSVDDNCDQAVDENCPCTTGTSKLCSSHIDPTLSTQGMSCRPGIQRCVNGAWSSSCEGEVGPSEETCDGIDNDCDGEVDEELRDPIGRCLDENPDPAVEDCGPTGEGNGLDDDGDGSLDEGCSCAVPDYDPDLPRKGQPCYGGPIATLGVGICHGGTRDCGANGIWGACMGQQLPEEEVCGDGLDNDCDGFIDEQCPICTDPVAEVCDGRDNDCDGVIDNGVRNACGGCGEVADAEICGDGLDNDCNGQIEEGCGCTASSLECYPGPAEAAGVGACAMGTMTCRGEHFGACMDYVLPGVEQCGEDGSGDGVDDDCDGSVDEDCVCAEGDTRPCGVDAGVCSYGTQTCTEGQWSECTGGTEASVESCDSMDNDCDGLTDEELLNACGTCGETCYTQPADPTLVGQADEGAEPIEANDPENPTMRAGVTLSKSSFIPPYLWAANHTDNTVTKYNTDLHQEEAIYWVGANPSRTAVDLDGNMWVGGRNDGRLTKVLWDTTACPDRNGNGQVDTSQNVAGMMTQVNSPTDPLADECVVFSEVVNPQRASIRGVAAGPDGRVWIGYTGGGIQWIDPNTFQLSAFYPSDGAPLYAPDANGVQQPVLDGAGNPMTGDTGGVYGLVVDAQGYLYTSSYNRNTLARFDTNTNQWDALFTNFQCGSYGIAVDAKSRIWTGGWPGCPGVGMFDPAQMRAYNFTVPNTVGPSPKETATVVMNDEPSFVCHTGDARSRFCVTGVGVEPNTGNVWASFYPIGYTGRLIVDENDYAQSTWVFIATTRDANNNFLPGVGADLRGVGFDRNGYGWTLGLGSDRVFKIDPTTNERDGALPMGDPIGVGSHYTYSDFTGSTALSFTAPRGVWRYYFETQFTNAQADTLSAEAYVPAGTTVGLRIRALDANDMPIGGWLPADNNGSPQYFMYPPGANQHRIDLSANGGPLVGATFEVEARLTSNDANVRPILHAIDIGWQRP